MPLLNLEAKSISQIVDSMEYREVQGVICKEGDAAEELFVIVQGTCEVTIQGKHVATLTELAVFGESAIFEENAKEDPHIWDTNLQADYAHITHQESVPKPPKSSVRGSAHCCLPPPQQESPGRALYSNRSPRVPAFWTRRSYSTMLGMAGEWSCIDCIAGMLWTICARYRRTVCGVIGGSRGSRMASQSMGSTTVSSQLPRECFCCASKPVCQGVVVGVSIVPIVAPFLYWSMTNM